MFGKDINLFLTYRNLDEESESDISYENTGYKSFRDDAVFDERGLDNEEVKGDICSLCLW